jgi:hypothetical protein
VIGISWVIGSEGPIIITLILGGANVTFDDRFTYMSDSAFSDAMNKRSASACFTIIVGLLMMGMWSMLVLTGQVPYLDTPQLEIKLHIFTEMLTAIALMLGGVSVLRGWRKLLPLHYVSQGMLIYAIINSSGYYIDLGETAMAAMFDVLLLGTFASLYFYRSEALRLD